MWRRVASQSPTSAPDPSAAFQNTEDYLNAWDALGKLLANGRSLSGRERNCCYLNTGNAAFANISAVSGFDFPDDTRGVAITDWDADGDVDVWLTNRTNPRLRFLRNNNQSQQYLSIKLKGTQGNRDAIGARVYVTSADGKKHVRSLRAGEGYLAQSSKWLHFGLGSQAGKVQVDVRWPNGQREEFGQLAVDQRIVLVEGSGAATSGARDSVGLLASVKPREPSSPSSSQRIVLPARLPMPGLTYRGMDGNSVVLSSESGNATLVSLWATWCKPCLIEIAEWTAHQQELADAGVKVVLLCVDEATEGGGAVDAVAVQSLLNRLQAPFASGFAAKDLLDKLDVTQQILTKRLRAMPVPTSFLVDGEGRLAVVYKGAVPLTRLLADVRDLSAPTDQHRDLAVAFPGRWYTNPFPPDVLSIPRKFREQGNPTRALEYLLRNVSPTMIQAADEATTFEGLSAKNLSELYVGLGMALQQKGDRSGVVRALRAATEVQPQDLRTRMALTMVLQQDGQIDEAAQQFREMLKVKPEDPVISNNLAWLLATSPNLNSASAKEAIGLAEMVCRKSQRKLPTALDTLAAAYAASGDFEKAVATAQEALGLLRAAATIDQAGIGQLQGRLELYQRKQRFVETRE